MRLQGDGAVEVIRHAVHLPETMVIHGKVVKRIDIVAVLRTEDARLKAECLVGEVYGIPRSVESTLADCTVT